MYIVNVQLQNLHVHKCKMYIVNVQLQNLHVHKCKMYLPMKNIYKGGFIDSLICKKCMLFFQSYRHRLDSLQFRIRNEKFIFIKI